VAVVMHDGKREKWEDSMLLLTHGLENPPKLVSDRATGGWHPRGRGGAVGR
jgi:hypothetical protein